MSFKTEGVVLHTIDFRDSDRIVDLFTCDHGIVKVIVYRANTLKPKVLLDPLSSVECLLLPSQGELLRCQQLCNGSYQQRHLQLRHQLDRLTVACELLQAIRKSQCLHQPAPLLYQLFISYLGKLPSCQQPCQLSTSFKLKILWHDGHLNISSSTASSPLPLFSEEELALLCFLTSCRSFEQLRQQKLSSSFREKVGQLFSYCCAG